MPAYGENIQKLFSKLLKTVECQIHLCKVSSASVPELSVGVIVHGKNSCFQIPASRKLQLSWFGAMMQDIWFYLGSNTESPQLELFLLSDSARFSAEIVYEEATIRSNPTNH